MKQIMKKFSMIVMLLVLSVSMVGCSSKTNDDKKNNATNTTEKNNDLQDKYDDAISSAKEDIQNSEGISREDIEKAINYLNEYGSKTETELEDEHWHKMVYYSAWLQEAGKKNGAVVDHEFIDLANNVQNWANTSWVNASKNDDNAMNDARKALDDSIDAIGEGVDDLIDGFKNLIEGNNTNE